MKGSQIQTICATIADVNGNRVFLYQDGGETVYMFCENSSEGSKEVAAQNMIKAGIAFTEESDNLQEVIAKSMSVAKSLSDVAKAEVIVFKIVEDTTAENGRRVVYTEGKPSRIANAVFRELIAREG